MNNSQILGSDGFSITESIYTANEVNAILKLIETFSNNENTKRTESLLSIRSPLLSIPSLGSILFTNNFRQLINGLDSNLSVIKSIYFDKPPLSNWFVPNHQDLTINVKEKIEVKGYTNWVKKEGFYSVQPPVEFLENIVTARIHLDDTDEKNGALIIKPKSHLNGIVRNDKTTTSNNDIICRINRGGVMLMKPLLFHKSLKTINNKHRRVIHIELSSKALPKGLDLKEDFQV